MAPPLVLVGTNLGRSGQAAVEAGARWAREAGANLVVCAVLPPRAPAGATHSHEHLEQALRVGYARACAPALVAAQVERLGQDAPMARVMVREGGACAALLSAATELGASVLVLGTRADAPLSPVVTDVLRSARVPVLLARACSGHGCVVACTDLSQSTAPVVQAAVDVACRRGSPLLAVHVVAPMAPGTEGEQVLNQLREKFAADQLARELERLEVACRYEVRRGPVVESLLSSTDTQAELVVVGRPAAHGAIRHGTIARALAAAAHAPVLMVPL